MSCRPANTSACCSSVASWMIKASGTTTGDIYYWDDLYFGLDATGPDLTVAVAAAATVTTFPTSNVSIVIGGESKQGIWS